MERHPSSSNPKLCLLNRCESDLPRMIARPVQVHVAAEPCTCPECSKSDPRTDCPRNSNPASRRQFGTTRNSLRITLAPQLPKFESRNGRPAESETVRPARRHAFLHEPTSRQASFLENSRGGRHAPGPDPGEGGRHRMASANRDHGATAFGERFRFARGQPMTRTCLIMHTPLKRRRAPATAGPTEIFRKALDT